MFCDLNNNGKFDRDDQGLKDIVVRLGSGEWEKTDVFGYFKFPEVQMGKVQIFIDVNTIPQGYISITPIRRELEIKEASIANVDFLFKKAGDVQGGGRKTAVRTKFPFRKIRLRKINQRKK